MDGGINHHTAAEARQAGANVFVAGTSVFRPAGLRRGHPRAARGFQGMKRSRLWWGLPLCDRRIGFVDRAAGVDERSPARSPGFEIRSARPESIDLPGYVAPSVSADSAEAKAAKPAAPRTREELQQFAKPSRTRRKNCSSGANPWTRTDRAAVQALVDEITRYNEDIRSFEEASAKFDPDPPTK